LDREPERQAARADTDHSGRPQNQLGTATVYETHDHTEAMTLGDRVAVMRRLRLWFDPASCTCSTPTTAPT
jgi:ABC-type sugar transport system ATPase subunit